MIFAITLLAVAVAALTLALLSLAANSGRLDLEDFARRNGCLYIPVDTALVDKSVEWSKPVRLRMERGGHPYLVHLVMTTKLEDVPNV